MRISEKTNDLLNKFGSAQFDFMIWNTPDNLVARDKARKELSDYIAELEGVQRWIPVSERLPKEKQSVLALDRTGTAYHWEYSKCLSNIFVGNYTHWMPLPNPPEENPEVKI